jgi:hypothetical protein
MNSITLPEHGCEGARKIPRRVRSVRNGPEHRAESYWRAESRGVGDCTILPFPSPTISLVTRSRWC